MYYYYYYEISYAHSVIIKQELTAEAESKPLDEARNTVMATAPYRK